MVGMIDSINADAGFKLKQLKDFAERLQMQVEGESVRSRVQDMVEVTNDILLHLSNPLLFASAFQKTVLTSDMRQSRAQVEQEQYGDILESRIEANDQPTKRAPHTQLHNLLSLHQPSIHEFYTFFEVSKLVDTQASELLDTTNLSYQKAMEELISQFAQYIVSKVKISDMESKYGQY